MVPVVKSMLEHVLERVRANSRVAPGGGSLSCLNGKKPEQKEEEAAIRPLCRVEDELGTSYSRFSTALGDGPLCYIPSYTPANGSGHGSSEWRGKELDA